MRRLHIQIFGALTVTGLLCVSLMWLLGKLLESKPHEAPRFMRDIGALVVDDLPSHDQPGFERGLIRKARRLHASLSVWDARGVLLGRAGRRLPSPLHEKSLHRHDVLFVKLDDGRTLAVSFDSDALPFGPAKFWLGVLVLVLVLLMGSYFAARRITRRLELLGQGVTRFGAGDVSVRVTVQGRDEVAQLAHAFNHSAERISGLLQKQRRMLQSASHELRSPLARLRMAFELLREPGADEAANAKLANDAERDIAELDELIADLLLAGRLTDSELPKNFAPVVLGQLVREELTRVGAGPDAFTQAVGVDTTLNGDARMLKSLVRNLLENAKRYGRDPVRASIIRQGDMLCLFVDDQGSLLPAADHERIFEPFYRPAGHREGKDGGVGLGLALVRDIAAHHGGTVRYLSHEGHSRFEVKLPS